MAMTATAGTAGARPNATVVTDPIFTPLTASLLQVPAHPFRLFLFKAWECMQTFLCSQLIHFFFQDLEIMMFELIELLRKLVAFIVQLCFCLLGLTKKKKKRLLR